MVWKDEAVAWLEVSAEESDKKKSLCQDTRPPDLNHGLSEREAEMQTICLQQLPTEIHPKPHQHSQDPHTLLF